MLNLGENVTHWLHLWHDGDDQAVEVVTEAVYKDLRRLAAYYLSNESKANTLQATALVHEAYLQIASVRKVDWKGRGQFIAIVAQMMRRVLVDHARAKNAAKRVSPADLKEPIEKELNLDILAVNEALERMTNRYARCAQVVELRFFGGLEFPEIAEALNLSLATVERDWRFARAWLQGQLGDHRMGQ